MVENAFGDDLVVLVDYLRGMSDRDLVREVSRDLRMPFSLEPVTVRKEGRLSERAMPYGVASIQGSNALQFRLIAPIRVNGTDFTREKANAEFERLRHRSNVITGCIALATALLCGVAQFAWASFGSKQPAIPNEALLPPCLIQTMDAQSVACSIGGQEQKVPVGRFFPSGAFRLDAITLERQMFTATHVASGRIVQFQLDARRVGTSPRN